MATLLTHAAQLLTLRGSDTAPRRGPQMSDLGIISDGAVLIDGKTIVAAGPTDEVAKHPLLREPVEEIDCRGKIVLPGFVDSHTHPVFTARA